MSGPQHSEYKEALAIWFATVPKHWSVVPCRALVDEQRSKNEGGKIDDYLSLMANIGVIPYAEKGDVGNKKPDDLEKCKVVSRGDLVINSMNYGIGSFGLSELNGVCSPVYIVLRPKLDVIEERFALRLFQCRAFQTYAQSFGNGILAHRAAISWDILKSMKMPLPPMEEQYRILRFLDRETAKIDALVEEQRRLIELLKEKRQAVISHAVTKGLDPSAPMKDSGVEWLGEVPAHWDVSHVKRMCALITDGAHVSPETEDGVFCFVSTKDIDGEEIDFEGCLRTSTTSYDYLVKTGCRPIAGDVLFSKDGTIGRTVVVREDREFVVASSLILIRPLRNLLEPEFLHLLCQSTLIRTQVDGFVKGAGLPRLSIQNLLRVVGVFPPVAEQRRIADHLAEVLGRLDALMAEAASAISLLQERRAALISAAVTGKIDVRGLVPAEAEAA